MTAAAAAPPDVSAREGSCGVTLLAPYEGDTPA